MIDLVFFCLLFGALLAAVGAIGLYAHRWMWNRQLAKAVVVASSLVSVGLVAEAGRFLYGWTAYRAEASR